MHAVTEAPPYPSGGAAISASGADELVKAEHVMLPATRDQVSVSIDWLSSQA
jgi:hypothetical protein